MLKNLTISSHKLVGAGSSIPPATSINLEASLSFPSFLYCVHIVISWNLPKIPPQIISCPRMPSSILLFPVFKIDFKNYWANQDALILYEASTVTHVNRLELLDDWLRQLLLLNNWLIGYCYFANRRFKRYVLEPLFG